MASDEKRNEELEAPPADCGVLSWRPQCLQKFNHPRALLAAVCWYTAIQGFAIYGVLFINTPMLERRFDMQSSQVAWISGSYDIVASVLSVCIGYFGASLHKGRCLAIGGVTISLGCFIMVLPHLLAGEYQYDPNGASSLCQPGLNHSAGCGVEESVQSAYLYVFIIGQCLNAVGGAMMYTLAVPFLDNNIDPNQTPVYIGWYMVAGMMGPAMGGLSAGYINTLWVDFPTIDGELEIEITDARWVGAWWLGFVIAGCLALTTTLAIMCFPPELRSAEKYRDRRETQAHNGLTISTSSQLSQFKSSCKSLFWNPVFVLLCVASTVETGVATGFGYFMTKIVMFQFGQTAKRAGMVGGGILTMGVCAGLALGGMLPRRLQLRVKGMLGLCSVWGLLALLLQFQFLLHCEEIQVAGLNVPYPDLPRYNHTEELGLVHDCNAHCDCSATPFMPICSFADDMLYFSPCHAGCMQTAEYLYFVCPCIPNVPGVYPIQAHFGLCLEKDYSCTQFLIWLPLFFLMCMFTAACSVTSAAAVIRVIPDEVKTFGFGVQSTITRLLGSLPIPILMGYIFDSACTAWSTKCGEQGACWTYSSEDLSQRLWWIAMVLKGIALLAYIGSFFVYKPPQAEIGSEQEAGVEEGSKNAAKNYGLENFKDKGAAFEEEKPGKVVEVATADSRLYAYEQKEGEDKKKVEGTEFVGLGVDLKGQLGYVNLSFEQAVEVGTKL